MTIVMYIYTQAFRYDSMGLAAAMALLLMLIMLLALAQLLIFRKEIEF